MLLTAEQEPWGQTATRFIGPEGINGRDCFHPMDARTKNSAKNLATRSRSPHQDYNAVSAVQGVKRWLKKLST